VRDAGCDAVRASVVDGCCAPHAPATADRVTAMVLAAAARRASERIGVTI